MPRHKRTPGASRVTVKYLPDRRKPWCVQVRRAQADGKEETTSESYQSEQEAQQVAQQIRESATRQAITLEEAIMSYTQVLLRKGLERLAPQGSDLSDLAHDAADRVRASLKLILADYLAQPLVEFTADQAQRIHLRLIGEDERVGQVVAPTGKPYATESLRTYLGRARRLFDWARRVRIWPADQRNPFADCKVEGGTHRGKPQLTRDMIEQKFLPTLFRGVESGDEEALYVAIQIYLGLRPSEILRRRVQDVQFHYQGTMLAGCSLDIPYGKTRTATRRVPLDILAPYLLARVHGRAPGDYLFPIRSRGKSKPRSQYWSRSVMRRLCAKAGVPYVPPYSNRGMKASMEVHAAIDKNAFDDSFKAGLARKLAHADQGEIAFQHYVSADAAARAAEHQARQSQGGLDAAFAAQRMTREIEEAMARGATAQEIAELALKAARQPG